MPPATTTRRGFLAGSAALVGALVSGCGGGSSEAVDAGSTRTVRDAVGQIVIPTEPQRVVFMDTTTFANAIALGFPADRIAGVGFPDNDRGNHRWLEPALDIDLDDFEAASFVGDPNLEQIHELRPDLIVMLSNWDEVRTTLQTLDVPVYTALNGYNSVDEYLTLLTDVGVAVGRQDAAATLSTGITERAAALRNRFAGSAPATTALRVWDGSFTYSFAQPLFDELELPRKSPEAGETLAELSPEQLELVDGDILWVSGTGSLNDIRAVAEANPLWESLDVVRNGGVRYIADQPWGTEYSYPAVQAIFDEIEDGLDDWEAAQTG